MADRIRTIGTGGDYADPILWSAAEGNINDGDRAVGIILNDITMNALFRPNQTFPNGGLLKGNITVTGEPGVGINLMSTASTRIILQPSDGLDFEDMYMIPMGSQSYGVQSSRENRYERVIINSGDTYSIEASAGKTVTLKNCVMNTLNIFSATSGAQFITENVLLTGRALIQANPSLLQMKNGISTSNDFILGRGTYTGSETLINYAKIKEDAPLVNFGPGSTNYETGYDSSGDFVDINNNDYRIKANSPLATAGENGTYIGPFLEVSESTFRQSWITNYSGVINL